jgi:Tfp pilus assembly protein PilF
VTDRIEKLKEYLKDSPKDNFLKHALALEYIKIKNYKDAQRLFEEVLFHEPSYVGSYYHLGKLLERRGETEEAIRIYEKGLIEAKKVGDTHSYNELRGAYEELI